MFEGEPENRRPQLDPIAPRGVQVAAEGQVLGQGREDEKTQALAQHADERHAGALDAQLGNVQPKHLSIVGDLPRRPLVQRRRHAKQTRQDGQRQPPLLEIALRSGGPAHRLHHLCDGRIELRRTSHDDLQPGNGCAQLARQRCIGDPHSRRPPRGSHRRPLHDSQERLGDRGWRARIDHLHTQDEIIWKLQPQQELDPIRLAVGHVGRGQNASPHPLPPSVHRNARAGPPGRRISAR